MLKSSARSIGPCLSLPENPARLAGYAQLSRVSALKEGVEVFDGEVNFTAADEAIRWIVFAVITLTAHGPDGRKYKGIFEGVFFFQ